MIWQDVVLMFANLVFASALFPQVMYGYHKKRGFITLAMSLPTSLAIYAICVVYWNLGLVLSFWMALVAALLWSVLIVQRIVYQKP